MSIGKSNEAIARKRQILKDGIPDLDTLPMPADSEVESYALSSIVIEYYWQEFIKFYESHPVDEIKLDDEFWVNFEKMYIMKSEQLKKEVLLPKLGGLLEKKELTFHEKAVLRFLQLQPGPKLGFPSLDDLYSFGAITYRMLAVNLPKEAAAETDISYLLKYFMSLGRPHLNFLLVMLFKNKGEKITDVRNEFDWEKFEIINGQLQLKKEVRNLFEGAVPILEERLKAKGKNPRILQCPVLYADKATLGGIA